MCPQHVLSYYLLVKKLWVHTHKGGLFPTPNPHVVLQVLIWYISFKKKKSSNLIYFFRSNSFLTQWLLYLLFCSDYNEDSEMKTGFISSSLLVELSGGNKFLTVLENLCLFLKCPYWSCSLCSLHQGAE